MDERVELNPPSSWYDFSAQVKPGMLLWVEGRTAPVLVGHMSEAGGACDCCRELMYDDVVVAYRVVWEPWLAEDFAAEAERAAAKTEKAAAIADAMLYFITQHRWAMHHSGRSPNHEPYVVEARAELVRLIAEVLG